MTKYVYVDNFTTKATVDRSGAATTRSKKATTQQVTATTTAVTPATMTRPMTKMRSEHTPSVKKEATSTITTEAVESETRATSSTGTSGTVSRESSPRSQTTCKAYTMTWSESTRWWRQGWMDWLVKEATAKEQDVGEMVGAGVGPTAKAEVEQDGLQDGDRKDRPLPGGGERGEMESASTVPVEGKRGMKLKKKRRKKSKEGKKAKNCGEARPCDDCGMQTEKIKFRRKEMTCLECEESTSEGEWCEGCRTFFCTKCVGKGAAQAEGQSGSEDGHLYTWEEGVQIVVREELSITYRNRKPREVEEILCSALRRRPEIEKWIQDERDLLQYQRIGLEVIAKVVRAGQFTNKKGGWIHPYTEAA